MAKLKNETGNRYGKLTVIERGENINASAGWICKCECGSVTHVRGANLRNGNTTSCGCSRITTNRERNMKKEKGNRYGKLTVIDETENIRGRTAWLCECDCGNSLNVVGKDLRSGNTKSCGCMRSWAEHYISTILKDAGVKFKTEYYFNDLTGLKGGPLRFDFAIFKNGELSHLIEYDGSQHKEGDNWYREDMAEHDRRKNEYCKANNIRLLRFSDGYSNITIDDLL